MADNGFVERLRRVERVVAGDEQISQKQVALLQLDLSHQLYIKIVDLEGEVVPRAEFNTLKNRVTVAFTLIFLLITAVAIGG